MPAGDEAGFNRRVVEREELSGGIGWDEFISPSSAVHPVCLLVYQQRYLGPRQRAQNPHLDQEKVEVLRRDSDSKVAAEKF